MVGAVLLGVINLGMSIMGLDHNLQKVVKGGVLLVPWCSTWSPSARIPAKCLLKAKGV